MNIRTVAMVAALAYGALIVTPACAQAQEESPWQRQQQEYFDMQRAQDEQQLRALEDRQLSEEQQRRFAEQNAEQQRASGEDSSQNGALNKARGPNPHNIALDDTSVEPSLEKTRTNEA